jgi:hypothetical protein
MKWFIINRLMYVVYGIIIGVLLTETKEDLTKNDNGFKSGIQYEKRMRQQAHDSIVANCIYNNGIPTTAVATSDSVLKENFPKPNMNKLLKGE